MTKQTINCKNLLNDILSGLIVALVSIPISMGYASIAGLPSVYGLYGSLLPVLVFGLITSSPQFVVGVDAMPAAMVGAALAATGVAPGSEEALRIVPAVSVLVALWFVVFRIFKAGRIVKFISNPVMGGFISGVGLTIILMQVPKLFGGNAGTGEIFELVGNIIRQASDFNLFSFCLGLGTVIIILVCKHFIPKFPMSILMLLVGILLAAVFHIDKFGVKLLPAVEAGLPKFIIPDMLSLLSNPGEYFVLSLTISLVVMAQSLLASNSYASKYGYKLDNNMELLAYGAMNLAGAVSGSCPINGSVSRTGIADQFGCKSQIMSITSFVTMLCVVLFCTRFFIYLPVPILTGIVMSALIGIIDYKQAFRLWKSEKNEFLVFITAMSGVLLFGTIWGVLIGVILSFTMVVRRAVVPPRSFLGIIPGHEDFFNLNRNKAAVPLQGTVLYSFRGNLFFANIDTFQSDIEGAITDTTKQVIIDAHGIGNIDITAADRVVSLYESLKNQGIKLYITEHAGTLNDQFRKFGAQKLIEEGAVRRTVSLALRDCGMERPYPLEGGVTNQKVEIQESSERLAEFEWAFGKDAEKMMETMAQEMINTISGISDETELQQINIEQVEQKLHWGRIGLFDEEELLEHFEIRLGQLEAKGKLNKEFVEEIERKIEHRRQVVEQKVHLLNPHARELLQNRHKIVEEHLRQANPKEYERLLELKKLIQSKKK